MKKYFHRLLNLYRRTILLFTLKQLFILYVILYLSLIKRIVYPCKLHYR